MLVVTRVSFPLATMPWLAFGISITAPSLSADIAYVDAPRVQSVIIGLPIGVISACTVVASLVFAPHAVEPLALDASLALCGLAIAGLAEHEVTLERAVQARADTSADR